MKNKGPQILNQLTIPKFGKIFISMLKLDNLSSDEDGGASSKVWPTAITDLVSLPQCSPDVEHQKIYIRFVVKTM